MTIRRHWTTVLCALALCLLTQSAAHAIGCGSVVSGFVLLTSDLNCGGNGLIIGSDNTWIDLNGHTISCASTLGFGGSCQYLHGPEGIASYKHNNVYITGPGTINGFVVGVSFEYGTGLLLDGVTITGPPAPDYTTNTRILSDGVVIFEANCPLAAAAFPSALVLGNEISNHTMGIQVSSSSCVAMAGNNIHDNTGPNDAHGIDIIDANNNFVFSNYVHNNGINNPGGNPDSGITIFQANSFGNQVFDNYVIDNCGDGIVANSGAHDNNVAANIVEYQPFTNPPQCKPATSVDITVVPRFWDLAEFSEGTGNIWNANNKCFTQSAGIPAGICHI